MLILAIALRNIFRHRTRTIITLFTIAFGCVAIIFVNGFLEDALIRLKEGYIKSLTGHLQVCKQGAFDKGYAKPFDYMIDDPREIIALIEKIPGVRNTGSRLIFSGLLSTGDNSVSFLGQGVEPQKEQTLICRNEKEMLRIMKQKTYLDPDVGGATIEQGEALVGNDTYSANLGKGLAKSLDIKVGDSIVLLTNTVDGSINAFDAKAKGMFYTASKSFDDIGLRLPLLTAQKLLRTQGVNNIVVRLYKTEDTLRVKKELKEVFQNHHWDLEIKSWDEIDDFYTKTATFLHEQLFILEFVMTVVVLLSIFSTMNMVVLERTSEIGTLMAIGTKKSGVVKLFMYEGLMMGLLGGVIGVVAGFVIVNLISIIGITMPPTPGMTFHWLNQPKPTIGCYVFVFFLSGFSALISSTYPAYKASGLEIATALRGSA